MLNNLYMLTFEMRNGSYIQTQQSNAVSNWDIFPVWRE